MTTSLKRRQQEINNNTKVTSKNNTSLARCSTVYLTVFLCVLLPSLCKSQGSSSLTSLSFNVTEGFSDTFVGNVKESAYFVSKFNRTVLGSLRVGLQDSGTAQSASLFRIAPDTGVIRTAVNIDREQFCPRRVDCFVYVDVVITEPLEYLEVSVTTTFL